jgi:hypothetical protein
MFKLKHGTVWIIKPLTPEQMKEVRENSTEISKNKIPWKK